MTPIPHSSSRRPYYKPKPAPKTDIVFGIRAIMEAVQAGKEIEKVLLRPGLNGALYQELAVLLRERGIVVQYVPPEKLNRITAKNHQGAIAFVSPVEYQNLTMLIPSLFEQGTEPLILILDGITDVRNIGAIARSAECAGVHALVVPERGSAQINSDALKTSAGALNHIPVCRTPLLRDSILFLKNSGLKIVAATEKATETLFTAPMTGPMALILGSEETGISPECLKLCDLMVRIPVLGHIESLNVSAAASVLLYEVVRQRS
jgi:23S rRNA (guanosine2251-2'-O)-methyltransferase